MDQTRKTKFKALLIIWPSYETSFHTFFFVVVNLCNNMLDAEWWWMRRNGSLSELVDLNKVVGLVLECQRLEPLG